MVEIKKITHDYGNEYTVAEEGYFIASKGCIGCKIMITPKSIEPELEVITAEEQERRMQAEIERENERQNS